MTRSGRAVLVAVAAMSALAGAAQAGASAVPAGGSIAERKPGAHVPVPAVPESTLPDLTSATPLDEGRAVPPGDPVNPVPEQGSSRLGAAPVILPPLTFTWQDGVYSATVE